MRTFFNVLQFKQYETKADEERCILPNVALAAQTYNVMNPSICCCFQPRVAIFHAPNDGSKHELICQYRSTHLRNASNCTLGSENCAILVSR